MTALLWQTALLLLGAYFLGAFTGCLLRRTFFAGVPAQSAEPQLAGVPSPQYHQVDPAPVIDRRQDEAPSPAHARFERALSGEVSQAAPPGEPVPASHHKTPMNGASIPRPAATPAAEAEASSVAPDSTVQPHPTAHEAQPSRTEQPAPRPAGASRSIGTSAAAAAALAAATARHQAAQATGRASATHADQETKSSLPAAASSTGWASTPAPAVSGTAAQPPPAASAPVPTAPVADDLTGIRGIDSELQARLNKLGIRSFAQIAAWQRADVRRISQELGFRGRIEQENWIEQAQILMTGTETAFSRRNHLGLRPLAKPTSDEGERRPIGARQQLDAAVKNVVETVTAPVSAAQPRRPATPAGWDKLQRISHISDDVERLLNVQGVTRYEQVAHWTSSEVARFERLLGSEGRISRENWIEQAQILARGGETAYSRAYDRKHSSAAPIRPRPAHLAEAIRAAQAAGKAQEAAAPPKVDLTALRSVRSVRSEALRPGDPTVSGRMTPGPQPAARPDDLKRIRGIGISIEKKLNGLGYSTYEQIANWTAADVERISLALEFSGRIERENWIEQARILASGGQTEFARRLDRGEKAIEPKTG